MYRLLLSLGWPPRGHSTVATLLTGAFTCIMVCFVSFYLLETLVRRQKKKKKKKHGPDSVSGSLGSSTTIKHFTEKNTPSGLILSVSRRLTRGCRVWAFFLLLFIYWMRLQRWSRLGCNWHCFCRNSLPQALWIQ